MLAIYVKFDRVPLAAAVNLLFTTIPQMRLSFDCLSPRHNVA